MTWSIVITGCPPDMKTTSPTVLLDELAVPMPYRVYLPAEYPEYWDCDIRLEFMTIISSTVYETHLRENHTKEQMATQIAMRMINSLEGH